MKQVLVDMLTSKKFLTMIVALILGVTNRIGLNLPESELQIVIASLMTYIIGQGFADAGKEKAKIEKG